MGAAKHSVSGRERQFDSKRGSFTYLGREIDRAVEKLDDAERASKADAAAAGPRREKKLENFLAILGRNAFSGVADAYFRHLAAAAQHEAQLPAAGHRFSGVED